MVSLIADMDYPSPGNLNKRVVIRKRSDFPDQITGGVDSDFLVSYKRWVEIKPVGGSTYLLGVQTGTSITHRVKLRFQPDIDSDYEIVYGKTVYRVHRNTDIQGTGRFTLLEVEELNHNEV